MKLYTELEVRKAISYARSISADNYENPPIERVLNSITPIELPSDEEIEEKANKIPIGKWETGVDEEGGYYIEPNTNEKWRWGGSMVGKGQSYILYNVEYIEKEAEKRFPYEKHMGDTWGNGLHEGFIIGAEWMKEQILNQNKYLE